MSAETYLGDMPWKRSLPGNPHKQMGSAQPNPPRGSKGRSPSRDYRKRLKILEAAGHQGNWYTLEEARRIRREAGMGVDF